MERGGDREVNTEIGAKKGRLIYFSSVYTHKHIYAAPGHDNNIVGLRFFRGFSDEGNFWETGEN